MDELNEDDSIYLDKVIQQIEIADDASNNQIDIIPESNLEKAIILTKYIYQLSCSSSIYALSEPLKDLLGYFDNLDDLNTIVSTYLCPKVITHLCEIIVEENLSQSFVDTIFSFFVDVSFVDTNYSKLISKNPCFMDYLMNYNISKEFGKFKTFFKLVFNLSADNHSCFNIHFLTKIANRFVSSETRYRIVISSSIINFFKYGDVFDEGFIDLFILTFERVLKKTLDETIITNIMWCLYFWLRRNDGLTNYLLESQLLSLIIASSTYKNDNHALISLSMMSLLCLSSDHQILDILYNAEWPLIIQNITRNDELSLATMTLLANFAALGHEYIQLLFDNSAVVEARVAFDFVTTNIKKEIGYFFSCIITNGSSAQLDYFTDENNINIMIEMIYHEDIDLSYAILVSFYILVQYKQSITEFIDKDIIESFIESPSSECSVISKQIIEYVEQNY